MFKRLPLIILSVFSAFFIIACQSSAPTQINQNTSQPETREQSSVSIQISDKPASPTSGEIKEENASLIVDAVYPITGTPQIDVILQKYVQDAVEEFKQEAPAIEPNSSYGKNSIYINFTRTKLFNQDNYQSFRFDISTYTGGAHPNTVSHTLTFNMNTYQQLALADLFTPETNFLKTLSTLSRESLKKQLDDSQVDMIDSGTEPSENNFHSWTLDGDNLNLHFDPYQVAPYAAGPQTVSIKLSDLGNILLPEFQKAAQSFIPDDLIPSREARVGCSWEEFKPAGTIGLKLLVENCADGPFLALRQGKIVSHDEKTKIGLDAMPDERFRTLVEIFSKPINQTPEQAIQQQFISQLSAEEKAACQVKAAPEYSNSYSRGYIITVSNDYLKKLSSGDTYPEKICGGYAQIDGASYFQFQDFNAEKFIFIQLGDLQAPLDTKNIYILPASPVNTTVTDQQLSVSDL